MPKFLEAKLKQEYGANSAIPYKIMNARGYMRGNKETAKGAALDAKHASDMHPHRNLGGYLHPPKHKIAAKMTAFRAKGAFKQAPRGPHPGPSSYGAGVD